MGNNDRLTDEQRGSRRVGPRPPQYRTTVGSEQPRQEHRRTQGSAAKVEILAEYLPQPKSETTITQGFRVSFTPVNSACYLP